MDTRTLGVSARLAWFLSATKQLVCAEVEDLEPFELVIEQFKRSVEEQGGWRLLWNDGNVNEKPEEAAQLLFKGIAQSYCHANDIVIDREPNLGRGPVDFKFSNGYQRRALLEVKKLHNGRFWNGLTLALETLDVHLEEVDWTRNVVGHRACVPVPCQRLSRLTFQIMAGLLRRTLAL